MFARFVGRCVQNSDPRPSVSDGAEHHGYHVLDEHRAAAVHRPNGQHEREDRPRGGNRYPRGSGQRGAGERDAACGVAARVPGALSGACGVRGRRQVRQHVCTIQGRGCGGEVPDAVRSHGLWQSGCDGADDAPLQLQHGALRGAAQPGGGVHVARRLGAGGRAGDRHFLAARARSVGRDAPLLHRGRAQRARGGRHQVGDGRSTRGCASAGQGGVGRDWDPWHGQAFQRAHDAAGAGGAGAPDRRRNGWCCAERGWAEWTRWGRTGWKQQCEQQRQRQRQRQRGGGGGGQGCPHRGRRGHQQREQGCQRRGAAHVVQSRCGAQPGAERVRHGRGGAHHAPRGAGAGDGAGATALRDTGAVGESRECVLGERRGGRARGAADVGTAPRFAHCQLQLQLQRGSAPHGPAAAGGGAAAGEELSGARVVRARSGHVGRDGPGRPSQAGSVHAPHAHRRPCARGARRGAHRPRRGDGHLGAGANVRQV
mmetsp:Transcript_29507/g.96354  ORF Transcript_29507/g.96354 Transcript_29507/m.96354 type:complete len:484 (-) Transcript_29507:368-1819(-)